MSACRGERPSTSRASRRSAPPGQSASLRTLEAPLLVQRSGVGVKPVRFKLKLFQIHGESRRARQIRQGAHPVLSRPHSPAAPELLPGARKHDVSAGPRGREPKPRRRAGHQMRPRKPRHE